mmetsp:Transcript_41023/g.80934  ORF Transcript_41023/g.80934 Transcript_41023/m.80934 type:complete len:226 (-) Transcript_41023:798-1475(-)
MKTPERVSKAENALPHLPASVFQFSSLSPHCTIPTNQPNNTPTQVTAISLDACFFSLMPTCFLGAKKEAMPEGKRESQAWKLRYRGDILLELSFPSPSRPACQIGLLTRQRQQTGGRPVYFLSLPFSSMLSSNLSTAQGGQAGRTERHGSTLFFFPSLPCYCVTSRGRKTLKKTKLARPCRSMYAYTRPTTQAKRCHEGGRTMKERCFKLPLFPPQHHVYVLSWS